MKVLKKQDPSIFLATKWNLSQKSENLEYYFISKSGEFGPFFPWKILCVGRNHIFQVEIWRNFAKENKNTACKVLATSVDISCRCIYETNTYKKPKPTKQKPGCSKIWALAEGWFLALVEGPNL
jgi:hypothetical protein